jgi:membrane fusion protein, multidrug efflux system
MQMHLFRRVLVALAASAFSSGATAQGPPPSGPAAVTVAKPIVKEIVERDDYVGRFEAVDTVDVRARVSGYLNHVAFTDGAMVKQGDLLFVIDRRPYQAAAEQAEAAVTSAQARVEFTRSDLERAHSLGRTGNITEQTIEQRRQAFEGARGDLLGAQAALRTARLNLGFTTIEAPLAGRIGRRLLSEGNLVTPDQSLTTIVTVDPIYFYFDVDERSYLAYMRNAIPLRGQTGNGGGLDVLVAVTDEREPTRKGRLNFADNRVDQATGTIRVRALFPNPDGFLTPGLFGTIQVPGSPPYQGVLLPDEAIGTDQDRRYVWVIAADGAASQATVRLGPRLDGYRVIRQGLKGDESVVVAGLQRVRPGAKVTPQMKELPPSREASPAQAARAQVQ